MRAVYVIAAKSGRACKIGIASDPAARFGVIRGSNTEPLDLIGAWQSEDAPRLEKLVHEALAAERIRAEWFAVSAIEAVLMIGRVCGENGFLIEPWAPSQRGECAESPLRRWREANNLTTTELAARIGVTQSAISRIERGVRRPRPAVETALLRLTGLSRDDLALPVAS